MAGIPTSPLRREITLFRRSLRVLGTQQSVRFRCLASPLAASTPLLALERLILIPQIPIRLLALQRFCLTPPAQKTRPMGQPRLNLTTRPATTRPMARSRLGFDVDSFNNTAVGAEALVNNDSDGMGFAN